MGKLTGITSLYYGFINHHLKQADVINRIAPLQLTGKIEDYLTKEFVSYIHNASDGTRFAVVNSGKKGENKIDLALIKSSKDGNIAETFVEAKYFRNRHRMMSKDLDATDEHTHSLKDLHRQLSYPLDETIHGFDQVKLRSKTTKIYGLVFASYTRPEFEEEKIVEDMSQTYYKKLMERAGNLGFRYHDLNNPALREVYKDFPIDVLGNKWFVTLKCALWKKQPQ
jgi:hypothetical protein